jgi:hypothetical protein
MESLKEELAKCLEKHKVCAARQIDNYLFVYPSEMEVEFYSCKDYSGIIFETDDCRYDVCNN